MEIIVTDHTYLIKFMKIGFYFHLNVHFMVDFHLIYNCQSNIYLCILTWIIGCLVEWVCRVNNHIPSNTHLDTQILPLNVNNGLLKEKHASGNEDSLFSNCQVNKVK